MQMISYAQNFEDVILNRIFEKQRSGFYIDIGASHPNFLSVTKHFYDKGWTGINVDPLESAIDLFKMARPRDINLDYAILNKKNIFFYKIASYPELSTFDSKSANLLKRKGHLVEKLKIKQMTGNDLFEKWASKQVDFMKIDVEGSEFEVISSINFKKYRPKVILVEAIKANAEFPGWLNFQSIKNHSKWEKILIKNKYIFAYFDGLNRYYVSQENGRFLAYFQSGLCIHDDFISNIKHQEDLKYISQLEKFNALKKSKIMSTIINLYFLACSLTNHIKCKLKFTKSDHLHENCN